MCLLGRIDEYFIIITTKLLDNCLPYTVFILSIQKKFQKQLIIHVK